MDVFYNHDYVASEYAFDTTRKSVRIALSLMVQPIPGVNLVEPTLTANDFEGLVSLAHSPRYVEAVRSGRPRKLAESNEFAWDPGMYNMAAAHTLGLVEATRKALDENTRAGSLSSGQHHANRFEGKGYGTFNGVAIAALDAAIMHQAQVLILDFDAHRGGGTWDIVQSHPLITQVDMSVVNFDDYVPRGQSRNFTGRNHVTYMDGILAALEYASTLDYDLLIYNAGMDPVNFSIPHSDLEQRESLVAEFAGDTPTSFAMAGGYQDGRNTPDDIVNLHRLTIAAMAQKV